MRSAVFSAVDRCIDDGIMTEGRAKGIAENKKQTALNMIMDKQLPIESIAKYSGLSVE